MRGLVFAHATKARYISVLLLVLYLYWLMEKCEEAFVKNISFIEVIMLEKQQLLRDAGIEPTDEIIALALGAANPAYTKFAEKIKNHEIEVEWRYYNDGKAWLGKSLYKWETSRGTQKQLTAFWLSIWDGFFRVGFTFPERCRADLLALPLGEETKKMIEDSAQMGKLKIFSLVFDMSSDEKFNDIFTLIECKKKLK